MKQLFSGAKITVSKSNQGSGELLVEGENNMDFKVYGKMYSYFMEDEGCEYVFENSFFVLKLN